MIEKEESNSKVIVESEKAYKLDFTTSSAIGIMSPKLIIFPIIVFWFGGFGSAIVLEMFFESFKNWISSIFLLPFIIALMYFLFIAASIIFAKLLLVLLNLIHRPKEGIFFTQKGNKDYEFWCYRLVLKKAVIWLANNFPLPWIDTFPFRWFGLKIDFSSHLQDAWVDVEFIKFGRKVMVGQGAVVMSSMIVGNYLIIKQVILDDYVVVGGQATIAPGTIIGRDTVIGALSTTKFQQFLEDSWIYFGMPALKLKPNKYAESRRDIIRKVDVDEMKKYNVNHEINIDDDKKDLVNHYSGA